MNERLDALRRDPNRVVALTPTGPRTARDLLVAAAQVAAALRQRVPEAKRVVVAFAADSYACMASVFGTFLFGAVPVLVAHGRRTAVAPVLGREGQEAFLHDLPTGFGVHVPELLAADADVPEPADSLAFRGCELSIAPEDGHGFRGGLGWDQVEPVELGPDPVRFATTLAASAWPSVQLGLLGHVVGPCIDLVSGDPVSGDALSDVDVVVSSPAHLRRLETRLGSVSTVLCAGEVPDAGLQERLEARGVRVVPVHPVPVAAGRLLESEAALLREPGVVDGAVLQVGPERWAAVVSASPVASSGLDRVVPLAALPRNPNGILDVDALYRWMGCDPQGLPRTQRLDWAAVESTPEGLIQGLVVPPDSCWFEGHFVGYPLFPGAGQLQELVRPLLAQLEPGAEVEEWRNLKFVDEIRPGDSLQVEVARPKTAGGSVSFTIRAGERICTKGLVRLTRG